MLTHFFDRPERPIEKMGEPVAKKEKIVFSESVVKRI
jgi:hypothetical protein